MRKTPLLFLVAILALLTGFSFAPLKPVAAQNTTLVIESWRGDDLSIWRNTLIPAFNAKFPGISVDFQPSAPANYDTRLTGKLQSGSAGDLITCRPYDAAFNLFNNGLLAPLTDLPGLDNFSTNALSAWTTDADSTTYCVPIASVIHGFLYNTGIFDELGLSEPTTESEFLAVLDAIKADGRYAPLVMGTADAWVAATDGFQNIGPNYWKGEAGRQGLINGTVGYNEDGFLQAFDALAKWSPYLIDGYSSLGYTDAQTAFVSGFGAIYPAVSSDIAGIRAQADFRPGAFKPPVPDGSTDCYISDYPAIAMGMNASLTGDKADAARTFLTWLTTPEFAELYATSLPGFYPLAANIRPDDPVAETFLSWRDDCRSSIPSSYQVLSRGDPVNETDLWTNTARLLNGQITAQQAADAVQQGLASWFGPQANR